MNEAEQELLQYIKLTLHMRLRNGIPKGFTYAGMEDYLLEHAQWYTWAPLPKNIARGTPQRCFRNSFNLASRRKKLRYVEGIALSVIPTHHAWNVGEAGTVIDSTWPVGVAYFGVEFPIAEARVAVTSGGTMFDDPQRDFPLFRSPRNSKKGRAVMNVHASGSR